MNEATVAVLTPSSVLPRLPNRANEMPTFFISSWSESPGFPMVLMDRFFVLVFVAANCPSFLPCPCAWCFFASSE